MQGFPDMPDPTSELVERKACFVPRMSSANAMKVTYAAISMLQNNIQMGRNLCGGGRPLRLLQTQFHHNVLKKMYKSQSAGDGRGQNEIRINSLTRNPATVFERSCSCVSWRIAHGKYISRHESAV